MNENSNETFGFVRRFSDYFSMALNIGIGADAASVLSGLAIKHPDCAMAQDLVDCRAAGSFLPAAIPDLFRPHDDQDDDVTPFSKALP